jgi:hypothetical protein
LSALSLCLSRAWLGKTIIFTSIKWHRQKRVLSAPLLDVDVCHPMMTCGKRLFFQRLLMFVPSLSWNNDASVFLDRHSVK